MNNEPIAVLVNNNIDKKTFVSTILSKNNSGTLQKYNNLKGILFSDIAIKNYIEEEYRYDIIKVAKNYNRKLSEFSSGERRKIFLKYCLNQKPDYIIFDSIFDHLDSNSQLELTNTIKQISKKFQIIQLVNRTSDILNFIKHKYQIKDNTFNLHSLKNTHTSYYSNFKNEIPTALKEINYTGNTLVKFSNVCVSYNNRPIVKNINWTVKKGEFWQLVGPNGSGKSTLLSLITGENPKAYGQDIHIFGQKKGSGESIWDLKKRIGYFSTTITELFSCNQTLEHIILSGYFDSVGLYKKPQKMQLDAVEQWLKIINLSTYKNTPFLKLSSGQQRIALIIRALIKQPPLLILDEPLEGLDDENTTLVTQLINLLIDKTEITILYVSHRTEQRLLPTTIFQLTPSQSGSLGKIIKNNIVSKS
ncbi:ATP-binding cassette domain-containing protein [Lutibacter sp. A80]|uniref:ATP-binding cassette domain-containing protein n=1 Tax=Lutibacter sp. A80 TaxID=2918453 RepID=UPI001F05AFC4|nr:ATP-binding cassette domain-containing protein [Lutibacter sp. A80]UMB60456.1 ATP-binding cassette domain-containing protein [Lutibacter sp. A80]